MIKDNNFNQEGGELSTNFQGQTVNVYNGLSYSDVKEIALDVFKANFIHLKNEAAQLANMRAVEITEDILSKIKMNNPERLQEFQQPAMQDALFTAQKEFAKSGDKDIGDLLVDIIIDRAGVSIRNIKQIILDEALQIAPKLTREHLDTLTLILLLMKTINFGIGDFEGFKSFLLNEIIPFIENLTSEHQQYIFLEYLRCGQIRIGSVGPLEQKFRKVYKGFFSKGFTMEEFPIELDYLKTTPLIIPCYHEITKYQIGVFDDDSLNHEMEQLKIDEPSKVKLRKFFEKTTMSSIEIKELLIAWDERMGILFNTWDKSSIKSFELSHVGIAIGHANFRRKTGSTIDLSIWIK